MPNKPKTIAAAEKRVIKSEIATLKKAARKVLADHLQARKSLARNQRVIDLETKRLIKSEAAEMGAINRRIAILTARL